MADNTILIPAAELAARNKAHFPNKSPEYRQARNQESAPQPVVVETPVQFFGRNIEVWTNKYFGKKATNKEILENIEQKIPDWAPIELADFDNWAPKMGAENEV